jgi:hypothetical protein
MKITECPCCQNKLRIKKVECLKCNISIEGDFYTSPLFSLSEEHQTFIELFLLSSGSLKEMAQILGITYPTVRTRLNEIIMSLKSEMKDREDYKNNLLEKVDQGKISPEKAAQIIRSL